MKQGSRTESSPEMLATRPFRQVLMVDSQHMPELLDPAWSERYYPRPKHQVGLIEPCLLRLTSAEPALSKPIV